MDDALGDRIKTAYELPEAGRRLMPGLPVIARLDGNRFSAFTLGLPRPYDDRLSRLMVATTTMLVKETVADCGYTQSDEITLGWGRVYPRTAMYFDGKIHKLASILAAKATAYFNFHLAAYIPEKAAQLRDPAKPVPLPVFDCRVFSVPTLEEGANTFLWRELDATKNSISMAARAYFSHQEIDDKTGPEMQEMLFQRTGINWNDYPSFFKRGTYVAPREVETRFTAEELEALPALHNARKNPDLTFTRTVHNPLDLPPLTKVTNRAGVIFRREDPVTASEE